MKNALAASRVICHQRAALLASDAHNHGVGLVAEGGVAWSEVEDETPNVAGDRAHPLGRGALAEAQRRIQRSAARDDYAVLGQAERRHRIHITRHSTHAPVGTIRGARTSGRGGLEMRGPITSRLR